MTTRYWGYRIDVSNIPFFWKELQEGRLRQGWGYDPAHDLRGPITDSGVARNLTMFRKVKKGHILLVPGLPDRGWVSIVEATEDWDKGYRFEIGDFGDYGHIFPAKFLRKFVRHSKHVTGNIRSTLRNIGRFWSCDHHGGDINALMDLTDEELGQGQSDSDRLKDAIASAFGQVFSRKNFGEQVYEEINAQFNAASWESVLEEVLKDSYPHAKVKRVGGRSESEHGTDIKITIPGLSKPDHVIAVQVKDYEGEVGESVIEQINKASYWNNDEEKLIEKVVIFTRARRERNSRLVEIGDRQNVRFVFAEDLEDLLTRYAMRRMGLDDSDYAPS